MSRPILEIFRHIPDISAAEVLSEPFGNRQEDYVLADKNEFVSLTGCLPLVVASAYVVKQDATAEVAVGASAELDKPLASVDEFSKGYTFTIDSFHRVAETHSDSTKRTTATEIKPRIREIVIEEGLITIASFATLYEEESGDFISGLIVPKKVIELLPLEIRDDLLSTNSVGLVVQLLKSKGKSSSEIKEVKDAVLQNKIKSLQVAAAISGLHLPKSPKVFKEIAKDNRIGIFLSLPRKNRRKLLKAESRRI